MELQRKMPFLNKENRSGHYNINVFLHKQKLHRHKKKKENKLFGYGGEVTVETSQTVNLKRYYKNISTHSSVPNLKKKYFKKVKLKSSSSLTNMSKQSNSYRTKLIESNLRIRKQSKIYSRRQPVKLCVYRCQFGAEEESCCCSCNSDAMFEVMKSLYDCYKKKNCDNCNCILCGHLPLHERRQGEIRKSIADITDTASAKVKKEKMKKAVKALEGKSPKEKEQILKELALAGAPLPEGKTASEKKLIEKIRTELGLPPEPNTPAAKEAYKKAAASGLLEPLEGKSTAQKEKILRRQAELGIDLPEGRTASEKALIAKIKAESGRQPPSKTTSEKFRKAKELGLLTPIEGKTPEQKGKILRGLVKQGIPLPEGKTASEKKLIDKIRREMGLPPEPKTPSAKERYARAQAQGLITPLEGKSAAQKEKILRAQAAAGLPLPEGRTPSEKALIERIKKEVQKIPSEKLRRAKEAGLLTPLEGKTPEQKEKILRGLVKNGIPLPEGKTASEKKLIDKIRREMGLPPEPKTPSTKERYARAQAQGLITPLEGKTAVQKEKILRAQAAADIPLPEGKTASEKALIAKIRAEGGARPSKRREPIPLSAEAKKIDEKTAKVMKEGKGPSDECICGILTPESEKFSVTMAKTPSEKIRKAKELGFLTPLEGKTPEQKEKILRGLVKQGIPLPKGKTASEKKMIDKIRREMGLPPEPKTPSTKDRYARAQAQGLITPLEGKSAAQKEKILRAQAEAGLPLPEGRTTSEKALIEKIKAEVGKMPTTKIPSEKLRRAKEAGLLTPLEGKTPEQKEKILRGLVKQGIPLPEGKTASEKKLIDKIRREMGLPPEPKTLSTKERYARAQAQGLITPLDGKSAAQKERILRAQAEAGLPLPEGRTPSEKALIEKIKKEVKKRPSAVPSEKLRKAKEAGLLTPLEGKSPDQKEKILRGLVKQGIPLPEGKTASEKKLIDKIRQEMGLPPEPKTLSTKERYARAQAQGLITPLEGKSAAQKERVLRAQAEAGLPLPEGRTPSEKALIENIKKKVKKRPSARPSKQRQPIPLSAEAKKLDEKTAKVMKEGKGPSDECICGILTPESEKFSVTMAKTPSEKIRKAKELGLLTPLEGKTPEQKEKILRGLVKQGIPLPKGKTASEKKIIDKIRREMGLPPEPKTPSTKDRYARAQAQGLITPLEGKSAAQKERILRAQAEAGLPLPEGRTASEKELIQKIKAEVGKMPTTKIPSEKLRRAKEAGLLTPLEGKTPEQKEKILRGLVKQGIPLPEGKTASERKLIDKIRQEMGLPPEPKTPSTKERYARAQAQGLITPLEGKSAAQKERILRAQAEAGLPLPEGRTPSEKALIEKIKKEVKKRPSARVPSEKLRRAKEAGLLTPLEGKTPQQKEKILRGLVKHGIPLPEGKTASEKKLIDKIRKEMGLPPEPKTPSTKDRYARAQAQGLITPLEGKSAAQKEKILRAQAAAGLPLPEGRTSSEKALIERIKKGVQKIPSEKLQRAKEAGLLTPLTGKTPEQKEKILRGLAAQGIPLPEAKTASDKKLLEKVRRDMGLPPEPETASMRAKYDKAAANGIIVPLEGKTPAEKEKILRAMQAAGIPLPVGRSASEKSLIRKVRASGLAAAGVPSEKIRTAKEAGLLTPLEGKSTEQKEKILKGLAERSIPLPEPRTTSEKQLAEKIKKELGITPSKRTPLSNEAKKLDKKTAKVMKEGKGPADECICGILTPESEKFSVRGGKLPSKIPSEKLRKAKAAGLLTPLEGKTPEQKEKILRGLAMQGLPFPPMETASDKKLAAKIRAELGLPPEPKGSAAKVKYDKAVAAGLIVPLEGKSRAEKEKILRAQADMGIELPEGRTPSEKSLIAKIKAEGRAVSIPSEKLRKAKAAGLLTPLEGKSAAQKEKILKGLADVGIPLPEGKTTSEKALVQKVKTEYGIPPEAKTVSEKEIVRKAKAEGILTPLKGKSKAEKERILKGLAEAGLPMPEGKTASEKALIKSIRTAAGLPPEATPSEKAGKIKTKSRMAGEGAVSKRGIARAVGVKSKAGIVEEFQDVLKTTTCERGCGCDKKKIRFKHSYVKIRVTSPDISSLCPCPDECVPGVKGGVFVDNEGIKVTVGSAIGFPSFTNVASLHTLKSKTKNSKKEKYTEDSLDATDDDFINIKLKRQLLNPKHYRKTQTVENVNKNQDYRKEDFIYEYMINKLQNYEKSEEDSKVSNDLVTTFSGEEMASLKSLVSINERTYSVDSDASFDSSILSMTESSLSFSSCSSRSSSSSISIASISVISLNSEVNSTTSSHYICIEKSSTNTSNSDNKNDKECFTNDVKYDCNKQIPRKLNELTDYSSTTSTALKPIFRGPHKLHEDDNVVIFNLSQLDLRNKEESRREGNKHIIILKKLSDTQDVIKMVKGILSKENIAQTSSVIIVAPTSTDVDVDDDNLSDTASSTICIRMSNNYFNWSKNIIQDNLHYSIPSSSTPYGIQDQGQGIKFTSIGRHHLINSAIPKNRNLDKSFKAMETLFVKKNKKLGVETLLQPPSLREPTTKLPPLPAPPVQPPPQPFSYRYGFSMDTTQDRPCCCGTQASIKKNKKKNLFWRN